ncbi:MAG: hypothetical protein RLZZ69_3592 [Cyanobacteriota bacterium]
MTGKYGDLLKKARKKDSEAENNNQSTFSNTAKQEAVKPALQPAVNTENATEAEIVKEKEVSLTIKVPRSWRQHWVAECKREGKTLKEVVTEMLTEKYGLP